MGVIQSPMFPILGSVKGIAFFSDHISGARQLDFFLFQKCPLQTYKQLSSVELGSSSWISHFICFPTVSSFSFTWYHIVELKVTNLLSLNHIIIVKLMPDSKLSMSFLLITIYVLLGCLPILDHHQKKKRRRRRNLICVFTMTRGSLYMLKPTQVVFSIWLRLIPNHFDL